MPLGLRDVIRCTPAFRWALAWYAFCRTHRRFPRRSRLLFNDVLYRMKTSGELSDPLRVITTDKYYAKLFIAGVAGARFVVPTLAVLRSRQELETYTFPSTCCIKPTHLSGHVMFRLSGEPVDRMEMVRWLELDHYRISGEENYRQLRPGVIVEPLLFGSSEVIDYKFFCFGGRPRLIQVDLDRYANHRRLFFDDQWREQEFSLLYPKAARVVKKPENLDLMLTACASIAEHFDFVRVDMYAQAGLNYVGEITHCHGSATERFVPIDAEQKASRLIFGVPATP